MSFGNAIRYTFHVCGMNYRKPEFQPLSLKLVARVTGDAFKTRTQVQYRGALKTRHQVRRARGGLSNARQNFRRDAYWTANELGQNRFQAMEDNTKRLQCRSTIGRHGCRSEGRRASDSMKKPAPFRGDILSHNSIIERSSERGM
jgi:hypothetical protein